MKKHQFEEIIFSLSVIIALMCYYIDITWLFCLFTFKAVVDFKCATATYYSYKAYLKGKQKKIEMPDINTEK